MARPVVPLRFIAENTPKLSGGRALDVACGGGRHLPTLVAAGYATTGVDKAPKRLALASEVCPTAALVERDLEADGLGVALAGPWDLIVTTYFLWRPLISEIAAALAPGGVWLLQTFHLENHQQRDHPRRRQLCLEPGEAERLATAAGLGTEHLFEGRRGDEWVVQLLARRP